jgi:hypothetical protein
MVFAVQSPAMIQAIWKIAPAALLLLSPIPAHEQAAKATDITTANVSDIQQAAGFAKICGRKGTVSEENLAVLKASRGDITQLMYKAMDANLVDRATCVAYLTGIIDGWQEGHEHGVAAMVFPKGIPDIDHYEQAVHSLSTEQMNVANSGMNADPMCIPEHISTSEVLNVVVGYIQAQIAKNPARGIALTARMVHPALKGTFRCPNEQSKTP